MTIEEFKKKVEEGIPVPEIFKEIIGNPKGDWRPMVAVHDEVGIGKCLPWDADTIASPNSWCFTVMKTDFANDDYTHVCGYSLASDIECNGGLTYKHVVVDLNSVTVLSRRYKDGKHVLLAFTIIAGDTAYGWDFRWHDNVERTRRILSEYDEMVKRVIGRLGSDFK